MEYYQIPFKVGEILAGKRVNGQTDLRKSIHENIRLILKSFTLSYRFDTSFGCVLNKYHASTPPQGKSERAWREKMREDIQHNLKELLQKYETRVNVKDLIVDLDHTNLKKNNSIVAVKVEVIGHLTIGRREKFKYPDSEVSDEAKEIFPLMIPVGKVKNIT